MTPCPACHQPVELQDKHWGTLFTCPHCNAVFFVDWNGRPEVVQHETLEQAVETGSEYSAGQEEDPYQNFESITPDAGAEFKAPIEEQWTDQSLDSSLEGVPFVASEISNEILPEENSGEVSLEMETPEEEALENFDLPLDQHLQVQNLAMENVQSDSADFSDVSDFANSDQLSSPISYEVKIEGLDSSHLVKELKEAMTDSRFSWDVVDLLSNINKGVLVLPGLSPAKASVLINRIKYLPFKISWRQDVLSNS